MHKFLLSLFLFNLILINISGAQSPGISYQSPQTLYIGKPTTAITVKNTGGAVPNKLYPQDVFIVPISTPSLFSASDFVRSSSGDFFVIEYSAIYRFRADGTSAIFAGNNQYGTIDGTGTAAGFQEMNGIAIDASDNLYVTEQDPFDGANSKIRKITPSAVVTTYATGLSGPNKLTVASNGIIYVSEYSGAIIKVAPDGTSTALAGQNGAGNSDGVGALASFNYPSALVTDPAGNIYVNDYGNNRIRKITPNGTVTTLAGSTFGSADGNGSAASFFGPTDIAIDSKQNIIVADGNGLVRKVTPTGTVTTIAQPPYYDNQNNVTSPSYPSTFILDASDNIISYTMAGFYKLLTTGYSISPVLPAGLVFGTDGSISGTPTALSSQQLYTIRAQNSSGLSSATISLQVVIPPDPPVITSFTPISVATGGLVTITGNYFIGTTAVTIGGQPAPGYSILSPTSIEVNVPPGATSGDITVTNQHGTASISGFILIPPPVITSFSPTSGGRGTVVTITGTGFSGTSQVLIGGYYATYTVISSTQIQATVGDGGSGDISLYAASGAAKLSGFTYIYPPTISSVTPSNAGTGATVTINGSNLSNATAVKFGTTSATSFNVVSASQITAVVASGSTNGITVTTPGGTVTYSNFTFVAPPVITQVSPLTGGNGSVINIFGSNLSGAQVTIGGVPATVGYFSNSSLISVTVGSGASGDIVVVTPGGTVAYPGFIWLPAPTITSFSPQTAAMGDKVTVTGTNFTGATYVSFGAVSAAFTVVSPTSIVATVGPGASGSVMVLTGGGSASANGFVHLGPVVSSFSPTQGAQGTTVTINGTNFTGVTEVDFGGVPATSFTVNSPTSITAVVGPGKSGYVSVISPKGTGNLAGFVHTGPSIAYFTPGYAGLSSTSPISISGSNFTGTTSVTFGGIPASSFTVVSSILITAMPFNGASGDVVVTTPLGSDTKAGFIWVQPPTISSFTPASQKNGGIVNITGTNFVGVTGVKFGGIPAMTFFAASPTSITAYVGTGATGNIEVTNVSGTATINGFTYTSPVIQSISPVRAAAGQTITINGSNLDGTQTVQFGGVNAASFSIVSPTKITAVLGSGASGNVTVSGTNGSGSISGFTFVYPPVIYSLSTNQGGAGTVISINGLNLATVTGITIGGVPAVISSVTDNVVKATVGAGATGLVIVTTIAGTAQFDGFTWFPAPTISSFTPASAGAQTTVTITGTNFTGVTQVYFGSSYAIFNAVSATQITAQPFNGASGSITVTGPGGSAVSPGFIFIPAPIISSYSSIGDGQNAVITISGSNFDNASSVSFGGIAAASFTVNSSTSITARPGAGATGAISVVTPGGTGTLAGFLYQKPVAISSFSPANGPIGTTVSIAGDNFNTTAAKNIVFFGPVKAKVISATQTQLQVTAPAGATGLITVTNLDEALSASSNLPFLITNSNGFKGFSNKFDIKFNSPIGASYKIDDFDGDGQPDLLIAKDDSIYILKHGADPVLSKSSFSQKIVLETGRSTASMVVGDLDGDGKKDIVYTLGTSLVVLHNTSTQNNISFDQTVFENEQVDTFSDKMVLRDVDMDGKPDLVLESGEVYPNTTVGSVISFGHLLFLANTSSSSNISFSITDIDGDNKPDPILGSSYTGFSIFQNNSVPGSIIPALFPLIYILHSGYYYTPYTLLTADFDGDGKPDIVENDFAGNNQYLVSRNIAVKGSINTASFAQPLPYSNSGFYDGMQTADIDGDGKIDLIGTTYTDIVYARNTSTIGNISFNNNSQLVVAGTPSSLTNISLFDMDGDGRMDLLAFDQNTNTITIYNNGPVPVPVITAVNPLAAATGATVTITGKYFDDASSVNFGSKAASSFKIISPETVTAVVGDGESGAITLSTSLGSSTYPGFRFITQTDPTITSLSAYTAISGNTILITGTNLTGATNVSFGGTAAASFTVNSATSITAIVGAGASGDVSVTTPAGIATLSGFNFVPVPTITAGGSTTILSGGAGVVLTATPGTGYTYQWLNNDVSINGATNSTYTATQSGNYKVSITLNALTEISDAITVTAIFDLPATNFDIAISGATCVGSNNGSISIKAVEHLNYTATITGKGLNKQYTFTDSTAINNLEAGSYDVCITVAGQSDYNKCYNLVISQPQPLSVYATVNNEAGNITLNLVGANSYIIQLNGKKYTTNESVFVLPLQHGTNKLQVTTDKECQGSFEKLINPSSLMTPYPVPFQNILYINLGENNIEHVQVNIFNPETGLLVYTNKFINQSEVLQLDLNQLTSGVYGLHLILNNTDNIFKIIKQ